MDDWSLNNFMSKKINTPHKQLTMLCENHQMFFTCTEMHIFCLVLKLKQWETHRSRRKIHFSLIALLDFLQKEKATWMKYHWEVVYLQEKWKILLLWERTDARKPFFWFNMGLIRGSFYLHRFNRDKIQWRPLSISSCNDLRLDQSICIQVTNIPYLCVVPNEQAIRGLKLVEPWHCCSSWFDNLYKSTWQNSVPKLQCTLTP